MIEIKNLSKSYDGKVKAVDNISMVIPDGRITGFLGPNGAGKTTAIKMITGILPPDQGQILIGGKDIEKEALEAKRNFGFVPDNPDIFPRLKGVEYLKFLGDIYDIPKEARIERSERLSEIFGLADVLGNRIQSYSHGMRQKLLIIGALLHNPDNWILDEPMTGLDPRSSHELKQMMRRHADEGKVVFFSTHVLDVAEKICDRIAIIDKGKILFDSTVEDMRLEFKSQGSLESFFLSLTEEEDFSVE